MYYLVRPRDGAERSFAISTMAKGQISHHKLEQPTEDGSWAVAGKPVKSGKLLADATTVVVEQLRRTAGCALVVPVMVVPVMAGDTYC